MGDDRISDIPSIRQPLTDAKGMVALLKWARRGKPLLKLLGVDTGKLDEMGKELPELISKMERVSTVPDRFNDAFADRGWISHESLNAEVGEKALSLAEAGDVDAGERVLMEHFEEKMIRFHLHRLKNIEVFQPRIPLAEKALADYVEGRYYACVLVVLTLLDGFVNDLGDLGFFANDADLTAWDSIAAHDRGLSQLSKVFTRSRQKTRSEEIDMPYRHGIIHGRDLGYDNQMVAAKSWAALFATSDWALKVIRGEKDPKPPEPRPNLRDLLNQHKANQEQTALIEAWQKRNIEVGRDIPVSGAPEDYPSGTPERALVECLTYWVAGNFGKMASYVSTLDRRGKTDGRIAGEVREIYGEYRLCSFRFERVEDEGAAMTALTVLCLIDDGSNPQREEKAGFRMINEDKDGDPVVRGLDGGEWKIVNMISHGRPFV